LKRTQRVLVAILIATGLSACAAIDGNRAGSEPGLRGSKPGTASLGQPDPIDRSRLAETTRSEYWALIRRGKLRVIVAKNSPPFSMRSEDKLFGLDIELAQHLAQTLGVSIEFIELPTDQILTALRKGRGDLAIASLTRTAKRAALVNFSAPYLSLSQAALIERRLVTGGVQPGGEIQQKEYRSYLDLRELRSLKIGVKKGTQPERYARSYIPTATLIPFPSVDAATAALLNGSVQAVVHDSPAIRLWTRRNPGSRHRFKALLDPATSDFICMALRQGDLEFLRWLDTYIAELDSGGFMRRLRRKYIEEMTWLDEQR